MKNLRKYATRIFSSALLLGTVVAATFTACKKKEENNPAPLPAEQTISQLVQGSNTYSTLLAALTKTNLVTTLDGAGPFTVFAPTNAAFTASAIDVNALSADQLRPVLLYHVSASKKLAAELPKGALTSLKDADPKNVYISKDKDGKVVTGINGGTGPNGAKVSSGDLVAKNGVIHTIDRVLQPPSKNIVDLASGNSDFSLLVAAIQRAGLASTLSAASSTGLTVFAPTNKAFNNAGFADKAAIDAAPVATLVSILTYHVVSGFVFSTDLSDGLVPTLLAGTVNNQVAITASGTVKGFGNVTASKVTIPNLLATNGVVHAIDQVLSPPPTIVTLASSNPNLTILTAALIKADLLGTLGTTGLTVFAPTDDAFLKTLQALSNNPTLDKAGAITAINNLTILNLTQLTALLSYHVIGKQFKAADIPAKDTSVVTLLGNAAGFGLNLLKSGANVTANGVKVTAADVVAFNGVVHLVDRVIVPPLPSNGDIVGFLQSGSSQGQYNILVAAVVKADLVSALKGTGPLTLFAPYDDAFKAYLRQAFGNNDLTEAQAIDAINNLTATSPVLTINDLKNILLNHVVSGRAYSSNLVAGNVNSLLPGATAGSFQTLAVALPTGAAPTVKGGGNTTAVNVFTALPITYDITTTNGVIHTIDGVLLPKK
jgi:transforming growth factor-beta-induced protein